MSNTPQSSQWILKDVSDSGSTAGTRRIYNNSNKFTASDGLHMHIPSIIIRASIMNVSGPVTLVLLQTLLLLLCYPQILERIIPVCCIKHTAFLTQIYPSSEFHKIYIHSFLFIQGLAEEIEDEKSQEREIGTCNVHVC